MSVFLHWWQSQPSEVSSTIFFWLRCLFWLLGAYAICSALLSGAKSGVFGEWSKRKSKDISLASAATSKFLWGIVFGTLLGAGWSNYLSVANRYRYEDVLIVKRHDATHFVLRPARMDEFKAVTCQPVPWQENQKLIYLHYQQRYGCKDVSAGGAYKIQTQEIAHD